MICRNVLIIQNKVDHIEYRQQYQSMGLILATPPLSFTLKPKSLALRGVGIEAQQLFPFLCVVSAELHHLKRDPKLFRMMKSICQNYAVYIAGILNVPPGPASSIVAEYKCEKCRKGF